MDSKDFKDAGFADHALRLSTVMQGRVLHSIIA